MILRPENYLHQLVVSISTATSIDDTIIIIKVVEALTALSRLVFINSHLMEKSPSNTYLDLVFDHKKESLVRVANEFVQCFDIQAEPNEPPKKLSFEIKQKMKLG